MTSQTLASKTKIIDSVVKRIQAHVPAEQSNVAAKFVKQFYATAALEDLEARNIDDLYGSAISFWNFAYTRTQDELKLRIYNPEFEEHGWHSTHTIIELVQLDSPFLVDSLRMEINRCGMTVHLIVHSGGMKLKRDAEGHIIEILHSSSASSDDILEEAFIYLEVDRETDPALLTSLQENLLRVLTDVKVAVRDWQPTRARVQEALDNLDKAKQYVDADEIVEVRDFLKWIMSDHFTFLGYRQYELVDEKEGQALKLIPNSSLGVLSNEENCRKLRYLSEHAAEARELLLSPNVVFILTKTNTFATVHRPAYTDNIIIKIFDEKSGALVGIHSVIGLFTSSAYNSNPQHIPALRHKVATVIKNSEINPKSHGGKTLLNILETLPRDDLFQADADELLEMALGILHLQERQQIRFFMRKDAYSRFISCLVYVPRERFNTELRQAMQAILAEAFSSNSITFSTRFSDSMLARIHYVIRNESKQTIEPDIKDIEAKLVEVGRSWDDELHDNLIEHYGEERGNKMLLRYRRGRAFPASYREAFASHAAVHDIKYLEYAFKKKKLAMNLYHPVDDEGNTLRFKVYQSEHTVPLSDALPILENMGLRVIGEQPHNITIQDGACAWINDFGMIYDQNTTVDVHEIKEIFQDAFVHIWTGKAENDGFNKLSLSTGLNWREISILRAYAKYMRQIGFALSQEYIETTFEAYPQFAKDLVALFHLAFQPERPDDAETQIEVLKADIIKNLDDVANLDQDRILRRYVDVIKATLRTNYYQKNDAGKDKDYISFKINPRVIPDMPLPAPQFEIFVYSARVEGVHLRFGKVARGGLRWSDRREDFRTEILGLVKAQQVKNAVIVPAGAKGGFVTKCLPEGGTREEIMEVGISCYKEFISGLLDLTDNMQAGEIVSPANVVRYDEDDPYLVVAADKGTATFSNIANGISAEYDFWLSDAFASGGSIGYDHKKMGITARGAWESVKRHFREMGIDIQTTDFTVIGIGDMAGDVFGNGMLLSRHIKLVAAFNHMHIFIDPDPDPKTSYQERERLFALPRSSWADYNADLISKGGGIFNRSDKSIKLSPEIKKLTGLTQDFIVPNDLLIALLKSPVDLLWNGGIGTFVKGTSESNVEVGDRANDPIRINGTELQCKVVGEGGNLGLTQLGRVEYALQGKHIYTDFIDNSAGVDCSDHEVNIKILLDAVVAAGDLTQKQRNELLAEMTDEVAELVLLNNYRQTQAISLAAEQALINVDLHRRYIEELESSGQLDRSLEFLPDEKALNERKLAGKGLARPGIAVLLAYTKSIIKDEVLQSNVPEDPCFSDMLESYFPKPLHGKYRGNMEQHRLRREIVSTLLSNQMVNQMGFTFVYRLHDETGAPTSAIVRAYAVAKAVFDLDHLWEDVETLDNKVSAELQIKMMMQIIRLLRRSSRWFLRNRRSRLDITKTIEEFIGGVNELVEKMPELLVNEGLEQFNRVRDTYMEENVPEAIAHRLASLRGLFSSLDIIELAQTQNVSVIQAARIYFLLGQTLDLDWVRSEVIAHPVDNHWDALSREALRDDIDWQQGKLTLSALQAYKDSSSEKECVATWMESYPTLIERWQYMLAELRSVTVLNFTMFFVAIRELLDLTQTSIQSTEIEKLSEEDLAQVCETHFPEQVETQKVKEKKTKAKKPKKNNRAA